MEHLLNQSTEQTAIARLKDGDLDGMEVLVNHYYTRAVRTAYLVTGDPHLAEDVVQDVFLRLVDTIHHFDSRRRFAPWFYRSVVNHAINAARARQRLAPPGTSSNTPGEPLDEWITDALPGPEEALEAQELRTAVWQAIEKLSPDQRAAVVLRYYLEMDESGMVVEMQAPRSSIKWWLHSARKKLHSLLLPFYPIDPPDLLAPDEKPNRSA